MLAKIKDYISGFTKDSSGTTHSEEERLEVINHACAALLIETAFADKVFTLEEINSIRDTLKQVYKIEKETIDELIQDAKKMVSESTSLYEYTRLINDSCSYQDKLNLVNSLWKIAFADNSLDKYEEHLIRKISDLLHVSHSDFIKEKIKVKEFI